VSAPSSTVGSGGFAKVYEGRHRVTGREVALKVLDPKAADTDGTFFERFQREARIAAQLQHPNVVRIYDFGQAGPRDQPYIAMELLDGHDLGHEIALNGPLQPYRAINLFLPVLEALSYGHRNGVVHKDLKPANLFINKPGTEEETLVVLDFGVARVDENEIARLTDTGQLLGTPRYLAPEYIKEQAVSPAIDVYQIALIMSEAISGVPPVDGNPYTSMMRHCNGDLNIAEILTEGSVGEVMARALAVDVEDRYADASEFHEALLSVEIEFGAMPQQEAPVQEYEGARATISSGEISEASTQSGTGEMSEISADDATGEGGAVAPSTDSMPMPAQLGTPQHTPPGVTAPSSIPPTVLHPHDTGSTSAGGGQKRIILALLLLVVIAGGVLAYFLVLRPTTDGNQDTTTSAEAETTEETTRTAPLAPTHVRVFFGSEPDGATIFVDDTERGTTPSMIKLPYGTTVDARIELEGYEPYEQTLDASTRDDIKVIATLDAIDPPEVAKDDDAQGADGAATADDGGTEAGPNASAGTRKKTGTASAGARKKTGAGSAAKKKTTRKPATRKKSRDDDDDDDSGGGGFVIAQ